MRVYHPWIHGSCHWPKEYPWTYCYNSSRLNELVIVVVEWLATHKAATLDRVTTSKMAKGWELARDKGKIKVADSVETKKSCKFKADPLLMRETLDIEAKKWQHNRRIV